MVSFNNDGRRQLCWNESFASCPAPKRGCLRKWLARVLISITFVAIAGVLVTANVSF